MTEDPTPSIADQLLARAKDGDSQAIGELIELFLPRLVTYVRLRTGPRLAAKESISDLVQSTCREVLVDLPRRAEANADDIRLRLYEAAQRKIVDKARYWNAERRDPGREQAYAVEGESQMIVQEVHNAFGTPSQHAMANEELTRFEGALAKLSEDHRQVILLARVVGLPHPEIAKVMGRTPSATRNLLSRALTELTAFL